jgi:hypothetical protein
MPVSDPPPQRDLPVTISSPHAYFRYYAAPATTQIDAPRTMIEVEWFNGAGVRLKYSFL